jgi:hypothetical protein
MARPPSFVLSPSHPTVHSGLGILKRQIKIRQARDVV